MPGATATLADAKRQATIDHILAAARQYVLANGLAATMDQIAEAAQVSRRTLFRLFNSREQLLATAFTEGMADAARDLPPYEGDLEGWVLATCRAAHQINSAIGPGFFEMSSRADLAPELLETERGRRESVRAMARSTSSLIWHASGGDGQPPVLLVRTVSTHLSPYFTAAVTYDAGDDWQEASRLAYAAIMSTLGALLDQSAAS
jgi:AcrR family transcriptional regulator